MDFDYSPDQLQFKNELREFLIAEVPEDKQAVFGLATEAQYRFGREINLKLAARRWLANMIKNRVPCKGKIKLQIVTIYLSNIQP